MKHNRNQGFSIVELVVIVAVLAVLAGVLVPRVSNQMAFSRDERRLADMNRVRHAIDQFYADKGYYPPADQNTSYGGWDVSHDSTFIQALAKEGYLEQDARDPVNDETYHYRYFVYEKGSYGCKGTTRFYVLGIRNFENLSFAERNAGFFECANRNWGSEFAYVTGGGGGPRSE
jgi:type II secretory pathway pseudopilin PulG